MFKVLSGVEQDAIFWLLSLRKVLHEPITVLSTLNIPGWVFLEAISFFFPWLPCHGYNHSA